MLICAAIIRLVDTCTLVWFNARSPKNFEDQQHQIFVELQLSFGESIAQELTNFVSISLAILGSATMGKGERDEKFTSVS